jgi:hypothetical protein
VTKRPLRRAVQTFVDDPALCDVADEAQSVDEWWMRLCSARGPKERVREEMTLAVYIVWNLWKERNRRVFEHKELTVPTLAGIIRDDVRCFTEATRGVGALGM